LFVNSLGFRDGCLVPFAVSLAPSEQQYRGSAGIKDEDHPIWIAGMLDNEFLEVRNFRSFERIRMWAPQRRAFFFQQRNLLGNRYAFSASKSREPRLKLVGAFDVPCHPCNITCALYPVK